MENLEEKKVNVIKDNPYGLTRITKKDLGTNMVEDQITRFDSFIYEDSLRYFININRIDLIKKEMNNRLDLKTGLYEITYDDKDPNYYDFATMFNRLTDNVYAKKVYRTVKLLGEYSKIMSDNNTEVISIDNEPSIVRVSR